MLLSIEEQHREDEERRSKDRPRPWYNLLRHPGGASWRSTDRVLGSDSVEAVEYDDDEEDDEDVDAAEGTDVMRNRAAGGKTTTKKRTTSVLSRTQFNLLRKSERTNKQLRRTHRRMLEVHKALSIKRERERRLAANGMKTTSSSSDDHDGPIDGGDGRGIRSKRQSIEDDKGRRVGDWRVRRENGSDVEITSPIILCEDPSVAMSLSIGLKSASSSSHAAAARRMRMNAMTKDENDDDDENGHGVGLGATDYYYADNEARATSIERTTTSAKSAKVAGRIATESGYAGGDSSTAASRKPVAYGPEQAMTNLRYRFGPNYSIVRRVLTEVQSLLGGGGDERGRRDDDDDDDGGSAGGGGRKHRTFRPRRVLDFGSGVGSSGAAALDVFGVGRSGGGRGGADGGGGKRRTRTRDDDKNEVDGIDWIHSIDASQCMRETTEKVLKSVLEGSPWEDVADGGDDASYLEEERSMLAEYERLLFDDGGKSNDRERKRLERRHRRMERWEQSWEKRADFRTRLTFGESIVGASTAASSSSSTVATTQSGGWSSDDSDDEGVDDSTNRRRLPWQDQLDEQRRRTVEAKKQGQQQQQQQQQQKNKGSFDLVLCSYTLSELPSVPASLAAAALLWEKLAPNGVLVFVEPGTPDGFGTLRSVRSMLLECCSPPEIKARKRRDMIAATAAIKLSPNEKGADNDGVGVDDDDDAWPEECHVIAPCTHNGTCPMTRHQRDHVKRNTRFAKYEAAEPKEEDEDEGSDDEESTGGTGSNDDEEGSFQDLLDEWDDMTEGDKDEIKKMLGGGKDMSDDDAKEMLEYMDSMDSDDEEEEDEDDEENDQDLISADDVDDDEDVGNNQEYYNIEGGAEPSSKKSSIIATTDAFGTSFCSFVHNFPGGTTRKRGEKFTYLVLQKRVPDLNDNELGRVESIAVDSPSIHPESLDEIDIVDLLSKSVHHAQKLKKEQLQERQRLRRHGADGDDGPEERTHAQSYHRDQYHHLLRRAVEVEDQFLDSTIDSLGLEMLHGDERRRRWGRLIRAPLKKRGHVLMDYCSAGCGGGSNGGCSKNGSTDEGIDPATTNGHDRPDGTRGRITRHKVSRGWSARSAPGCYSAARKARWGGLWPDLSERVKSIEREDEMGRSDRQTLV